MTKPSQASPAKSNTCQNSLVTSNRVINLPIPGSLWQGRGDGFEQYQVRIDSYHENLVTYRLHGFPDSNPHQTELAIFLLIYTPCEQTKTVSFSSRITSLWRRFWSIAYPKRSRGNAQKAKDATS